MLNEDGQFVTATDAFGKIADLRRTLADLPDDAPCVEWGRWFLADRATRSIAPGFTITPADAEKHADTVSAPAPHPRGSRECGTGFPARGLGESGFRGETNRTGWKARATTETNPPRRYANGSAINLAAVAHLVEEKNVPRQIERVENAIIRDSNSTFAPPLQAVMRISFQLSAQLLDFDL